jgi:Flp pilus assembly protein TadD
MVMSHPEVAFSLSRLAEFNLQRGHDKESESLTRRALAILELSHAGPPTAVAFCFDILAQLETRNGQLTAAEGHFRQALSLREKVQVADHPDIGRVWNHYAALLRQSGRTAEAEAAEQRSQRKTKMP